MPFVIGFRSLLQFAVRILRVQGFSDLLKQYVNVVLGLPLQAPLERSSYGRSGGDISADEFDDYSPREKLAGKKISCLGLKTRQISLAVTRIIELCTTGEVFSKRVG